MEEAIRKMNGKLQLLQLTHSKTKAIVEKNNTQAILRHKETLITIITAVESLKREVDQAKLDAGESAEDVAVWGHDVEQQISEIDSEITFLDKHVAEAMLNEDLQRKEKENDLTVRDRESQLEFERAKLELKLEFERKTEETRKSQGFGNAPKEHVKLPKLTITKFDGSYEQWLPFWNKFEAEIETTSLAPVTKFAYLKELVEPKVRADIDGLPFTTEGYERAKNILKSEYGKTSEIVHAYVQNIAALPVITGSQPAKIHQFYKTLLYNVQSLETLGKLREISGNVRSVIDKLKGIKADLVRGQEGWQDWDFSQLVQALKRWKEINPVETHEKPADKHPPSRTRSFHTQEQLYQTKGCVYCEDTGHKSANCDKVTSVAERKKLLSAKRLCFNCTGSKHRAADCRSRSVCQNCQRKHHTSVCDVVERGQVMTATYKGGAVCHPVVLVEVNGVKCRALLDTGAGSSYASAALLDRLSIRPGRTEVRRIEMMIGAVTKRMEIYKLRVGNTNGDFALETEVTKVDRKELLSLENPRYSDMKHKYSHLQGVEMEDKDERSMLPVHLILGASEYTKIKTTIGPKVGRVGEPVAEKTRFGWTIMSPGEEINVSNMFLAQTSVADYEGLCRIDVLGLEDSPTGDQETVYAEFQEQLKRNPEGWYETGLPWKGNHTPLPNNEMGSLRRLDNLTRKLERTQRLHDYDAVIQDQLKQGVVERVEARATGVEYYIPHKAVVREAASSTKLRIVYDASARAHQDAPSLNDCLEVGPPLQNQLWKVLVRGRFHPVAIAGDMKQAFLQVRIREEDRDALRFHWYNDLQSKRIETLRFTRALFGLAPSPFLLAGVIRQHLESCRQEYPKCVEEIERSLYVDDLISGGSTVQEAQRIKDSAIEIFEKAKFQLHKWNSNARELELTEAPSCGEEQSYAKQQLGQGSEESGLLGLMWNKRKDTIGVRFPSETAEPTKRGILGKVARIYDPLGLVSPITLGGKVLYRDACNEKCAWDAPLSGDLTKRWARWERELPHQVITPRTLAKHQPISDVTLHAFGEASGKGVAAAVYAVVTQPSGVNQGLVAAKARLAKQGLTIPRLELVSGHMAANLAHNVREALEGFTVSHVYCWLDSSVALHWIRGAGEYKQFVGNRVRKIQERGETTWRHVGTKENPADLGSRGGDVGEDQHLWWRGPQWLADQRNWPPDIITTPSQESLAETKAAKEVFGVALVAEDEFENLLAKWSLWRTLRICAWITRFTRNAKGPKEDRVTGPLTTVEINSQTLWWQRRVQGRDGETDQFQEDRMRLNLQPNENGVLECRGRIQGHFPVYLPDKALYTEKYVQHAHEATLHGGVGLTMAKVRERIWVPRLRSLAKRVIKSCWGCKRFQVAALASPPPGNLPIDRTVGHTAFQVVGVDFAGPLCYRTRAKKEGKAYIVLYACSLSRALYLELLSTLETSEFLGSLKRLIARRGRPEKIYSDNGRTFVGAAKWLEAVMRDERFNDFLAHKGIQWQFNLSRAPWWGGQFERMVGLLKRALHKSIGNGFLTWNELQEVLLDAEVALNNRPLSYVEDDVEMPILTPNSLMFTQPNTLPELEAHHVDKGDLRTRARYLKRCKDAVWERWTREYVRGLRERHNLKHKVSQMTLAKGDVVIIKGDERNRGKWKLGIVENLISGRDGIVRGAKLRAGKSYLERAVQHLFPLELSCDRGVAETRVPSNANTPAVRPRRAAADVARRRIQDIAQEDQSDH